MNILDILDVGVGAATKADALTTIKDAGLLYEDYVDFKAGRLKVKTLAATGKLLPMAKALAWEVNLLVKLLEDPAQQKEIVDLATENGL